MHEIVLSANGDFYRKCVAALRKDISLTRSGPDIRVRVTCAPEGLQQVAVDAVISRTEVWLEGLVIGDTGVRFTNSNPVLEGISFAYKAPTTTNYSHLKPWDASYRHRGVHDFYYTLLHLAGFRPSGTFDDRRKLATALMIFMISEAVRFWPISRAIGDALKGDTTFRFTDWTDSVTNWSKFSEGEQRGALNGVILPKVF